MILSNISFRVASTSILASLSMTLYSKPTDATSLSIARMDCSAFAIAGWIEGADTHFRRGEYTESDRLERAVTACLQAATPPNARALAASLARRAELSRIQGHSREAEARLREAIAIHESELPMDTPQYAAALAGLATIYSDKKRFIDAEPLVRKAIGIYHQLSPPDRSGERSAMNTLGTLYAGLGDTAGAEQIFRHALAQHEGVAANEVTATLLHNLATIRLDRGDEIEAEKLYGEALDLQQQILPQGHPDLQATRKALALVRMRLEKKERDRGLRSMR
jgi:tetratricopeptide (TPR) repeat protein